MTNHDPLLAMIVVVLFGAIMALGVQCFSHVHFEHWSTTFVSISFRIATSTVSSYPQIVNSSIVLQINTPHQFWLCQIQFDSYPMILSS